MWEFFIIFFVDSLWFVVGGFSASLGATAATRIGALVDKRSRGNQLNEWSYPTLIGIIQKLIGRSSCDSCGSDLPVLATLPFIGEWCWACRNGRCPRNHSDRIRVNLPEIIGGSIMVLAWHGPNSSDHMLVVAVIPFLVNFMLTGKQQLYLQPVTGMSFSRSSSLAWNNLSYLMWASAFILTGIGFSAVDVIETRFQVLGALLFGLVGWIFGRLCVDGPKFKLKDEKPRQSDSMPVRCSLLMLLAGAWLGVLVGMIIVALSFLLIRFGGSSSYFQRCRYLEERMLGIGFVMFLVSTCLCYAGYGQPAFWREFGYPTGHSLPVDCATILCDIVGIFGL